MQGKIRFLSKRHFENNFIIYFLLLVFLITGIIIGSTLVNKIEMSENQRIINYLCPLMNYINHQQLSTDILKISLLSNAKFALMVYLSGFIFIGTIIIPLMIGIRGMSIGLTVGFLVKKFGIKGFVFALSGLLPHYLILLPGIIAICSLALSNINSNTSVKISSSRRLNKMDLIDYSLLCLVFFIIILMGTLVESFITPYFIKLTRLNL